jgi:hypothetical protein
VAEYLYLDDLGDELDADTLTYLAGHTAHVGLDGRPCIDASSLAELLRLREIEHRGREPR